MMYSNYYRAKSVAAAISFLDSHKSSHPILVAGGTDIILQLYNGSVKTDTLVDISHIRELKHVKLSREKISIGSSVTFSEMIETDIIGREFPILVEACRQIGATQIRNMGTLGGNICTASGAADMVPCLVALDAELVLFSVEGERVIFISSFIQTNRKTALKPTELLKEVRIKRLPPSTGAAFVKMGLRASQAISVLNTAVTLSLDEGLISRAAVVVGCAGPKAINCTNATEMLLGNKPTEDLFQAVGTAVLEELSPMSDIRSSSAFRNHIAGVLVPRALRLAHERILINQGAL